MFKIKLDDHTEIECETLEQVKEELLNALSEQVFADQIVNTKTGEVYGATWSVELEVIDQDDGWIDSPSSKGD